MPTRSRPSPLEFAHQTKQVRSEGLIRRVLRASILIVAVAVVSTAVLMVKDPIGLFAEVTASLVDRFGMQPATDRTTPTIESSAETRALPIAKDAPVRDEVDASKPAVENQAKTSEAQSEAMFRQFQAWAAEKDAQIEPEKPVQDASEILQGPPARLANQSRRVRPVAVHNVRPVSSTRNPRKQPKPLQNARAQLATMPSRSQGPSNPIPPPNPDR
jgi:hypothetical protein